MLCDITIGELGIKRLVPTPNQVRHCLLEVGPKRWSDDSAINQKIGVCAGVISLIICDSADGLDKPIFNSCHIIDGYCLM